MQRDEDGNLVYHELDKYDVLYSNLLPITLNEVHHLAAPFYGVKIINLFTDKGRKIVGHKYNGGLNVALFDSNKLFIDPTTLDGGLVVQIINRLDEDYDFRSNCFGYAFADGICALNYNVVDHIIEDDGYVEVATPNHDFEHLLLYSKNSIYHHVSVFRLSDGRYWAKNGINQKSSSASYENIEPQFNFDDLKYYQKM